MTLVDAEMISAGQAKTHTEGSRKTTISDVTDSALPAQKSLKRSNTTDQDGQQTACKRIKLLEGKDDDVCILDHNWDSEPTDKTSETCDRKLPSLSGQGDSTGNAAIKSSTMSDIQHPDNPEQPGEPGNETPQKNKSIADRLYDYYGTDDDYDSDSEPDPDAYGSDGYYTFNEVIHDSCYPYFDPPSCSSPFDSLWNSAESSDNENSAHNCRDEPDSDCIMDEAHSDSESQEVSGDESSSDGPSSREGCDLDKADSTLNDRKKHTTQSTPLEISSTVEDGIASCSMPEASAGDWQVAQGLSHQYLKDCTGTLPTPQNAPLGKATRVQPQGQPQGQTP